MNMKRPLLALLLTSVALPGCQSAHNAAVAGFRVLDAPHQYIRRKLDVDDQDRADTTTTTTESDVAYQQAPPPPPPPQSGAPRQPFTTQAPPPPPPRRQVVVTERTQRTSQLPPEATPPPAPRVTTRTSTTESRTAQATPPPAPRSEVSEGGSLPYAKPVPGKAGYVFSPYDKNGGYVDVTGFAPGSKVKDPYSGKVFLVP